MDKEILGRVLEIQRIALEFPRDKGLVISTSLLTGCESFRVEIYKKDGSSIIYAGHSYLDWDNAIERLEEIKWKVLEVLVMIDELDIFLDCVAKNAAIIRSY